MRSKESGKHPLPHPLPASRVPFHASVPPTLSSTPTHCCPVYTYYYDDVEPRPTSHLFSFLCTALSSVSDLIRFLLHRRAHTHTRVSRLEKITLLLQSVCTHINSSSSSSSRWWDFSHFASRIRNHLPAERHKVQTQTKTYHTQQKNAASQQGWPRWGRQRSVGHRSSEEEVKYSLQQPIV